jgi:hypothetical protein
MGGDNQPGFEGQKRASPAKTFAFLRALRGEILVDSYKIIPVSSPG